MWDLIVSVPDHCLSFYFAVRVQIKLILQSKSCGDLAHQNFIHSFTNPPCLV